MANMLYKFLLHFVFLYLSMRHLRHYARDVPRRSCSDGRYGGEFSVETCIILIFVKKYKYIGIEFIGSYI